MLLAADDPWYQTELFVGIAAALIGAAATFGVVYLQIRRLRVRWEETGNTALLSTNDSSITVTHSGAVLSNPRVVEVTLKNPNRRDILDNHYLNGQSLVFDLGAPIVGLLSRESTPATRVPTAAVVNGTQLEIGPGALSAGQICTYKLLVDGQKKDVKLLLEPFTGAKLKDGLVPPLLRNQQFLLQIGTTLVSLIVALIALIAQTFIR
ncbi:hypothetical protein [Streptomyces sp. NPDC058247]|uniref:hypothetical protein n=1 Tax=Streptomyces sp. NPDC058247 TaxID=3346401 RepID=UPI0036F02608